jgi:hypothetical protein
VIWPSLSWTQIRAQDVAQARDWAGLLALRADLERDTVFWADLRGPACALAARLTGQPGAAGLLAELVRAGFRQPELFDGEIEAAFGDDEGWPQPAAQFAAGDADRLARPASTSTPWQSRLSTAR